MSEEHLKFEGRLTVNRNKRMQLSLRMQGLVKSLRDLLDPTRPVEHLEMELISAQALDLAALGSEHRRLLQEAQAINHALGR